jgi:glucokinase
MTDRDVFEPFRGQFDIVPATLGEAVVVHGALALARDAITTIGKPITKARKTKTRKRRRST